MELKIFCITKRKFLFIFVIPVFSAKGNLKNLMIDQENFKLLNFNKVVITKLKKTLNLRLFRLSFFINQCWT